MILRRSYNQSSSDLPLSKPLPESSQQQYQLLLQFDLRREKEKNQILQERLKNKENFIQQMKHFQEELTQAYQQCKNDLILAQEKIQYLQNVQYREYTEQIADLKHMLMLKTQESKRNSIGREERNTFSSFNTKALKNNQKGFRSKTTDKRQSKSSSNHGTHRQKSSTDRMQNQVSKQLKKSADFITHFLQMAQCYVTDIKSQSKLTKKLKRSWKWIKDVVKEWDRLSEKVKQHQKFKEDLTKIFKTQKDIDFDIFLEVIKTRQIQK